MDSRATTFSRLIRRKADIDEEKFILSINEPPRNLIIPSKRLGSTVSGFFLLIPLNRISRSQLEKTEWPEML